MFTLCQLRLKLQNHTQVLLKKLLKQLVNILSKIVVKRREVRQVVVQTLYQMISAHKDLDINEAVAYALEAGVFPEEGYEGIDNEYFYELIEGVRSKETEIDNLIEPYLTGWSVDRIVRMYLCIFLVELYEYFFVSNV